MNLRATPKLTEKHISGAEAQALLKRQPRIRNVASKDERTYNGTTYHSKSEALYAFELDCLKSGGRIASWRPQVVMPIVVQNVHICKVVIDFEVTPKSGKPWFIEIKGMETEVYKLKRKLLRACYPNLDYRVIKVGAARQNPEVAHA